MTNRSARRALSGGSSAGIVAKYREKNKRNAGITTTIDHTTGSLFDALGDWKGLGNGIKNILSRGKEMVKEMADTTKNSLGGVLDSVRSFSINKAITGADERVSHRLDMWAERKKGPTLGSLLQENKNIGLPVNASIHAGKSSDVIDDFVTLQNIQSSNYMFDSDVDPAMITVTFIDRSGSKMYRKGTLPYEVVRKRAQNKTKMVA